MIKLKALLDYRVVLLIQTSTAAVILIQGIIEDSVLNYCASFVIMILAIGTLWFSMICRERGRWIDYRIRIINEMSDHNDSNPYSTGVCKGLSAAYAMAAYPDKEKRGKRRHKQ